MVLEVDGREVASQTLVLPTDGPARVTFDTVALARSEARVTVRVESDALTNDDRVLLLYVDGAVVAPKGLPTGQPLMALHVPLGATRYDGLPHPTEAHHSGTYDELQLYNRALTAREITGIITHAQPSTIGRTSTAPSPATQPTKTP